eukprot:1194660-Prorocentrum_minimum.AAC.4
MYFDPVRYPCAIYPSGKEEFLRRFLVPATARDSRTVQLDCSRFPPPDVSPTTFYPVRTSNFESKSPLSVSAGATGPGAVETVLAEGAERRLVRRPPAARAHRRRLSAAQRSGEVGPRDAGLRGGQLRHRRTRKMKQY